MALLYRCRGSIASLETALWLHGLLEQEPSPIWISIAHKARKPYLPPLEVEALRWTDEPHPDDVVWTPFIHRGRRFPVFDLAKTAVDLVRARYRIGEQRADALLDLLVPKLVTPQQLTACAARSHAAYPVERYLRRMRKQFASTRQNEAP